MTMMMFIGKKTTALLDKRIAPAVEASPVPRAHRPGCRSSLQVRLWPLRHDAWREGEEMRKAGGQKLPCNMLNIYIHRVYICNIHIIYAHYTYIYNMYMHV